MPPDAPEGTRTPPPAAGTPHPATDSPVDGGVEQEEPRSTTPLDFSQNLVKWKRVAHWASRDSGLAADEGESPSKPESPGLHASVAGSPPPRDRPLSPDPAPLGSSVATDGYHELQRARAKLEQARSSKLEAQRFAAGIKSALRSEPSSPSRQDSVACPAPVQRRPALETSLPRSGGVAAPPGSRVSILQGKLAGAEEQLRVHRLQAEARAAEAAGEAEAALQARDARVALLERELRVAREEVGELHNKLNAQIERGVQLSTDQAGLADSESALRDKLEHLKRQSQADKRLAAAQREDAERLLTQVRSSSDRRIQELSERLEAAQKRFRICDKKLRDADATREASRSAVQAAKREAERAVAAAAQSQKLATAVEKEAEKKIGLAMTQVDALRRELRLMSDRLGARDEETQRRVRDFQASQLAEAEARVKAAAAGGASLRGALRAMLDCTHPAQVAPLLGGAPASIAALPLGEEAAAQLAAQLSAAGEGAVDAGLLVALGTHVQTVMQRAGLHMSGLQQALQLQEAAALASDKAAAAAGEDAQLSLHVMSAEVTQLSDRCGQLAAQLQDREGHLGLLQTDAEALAERYAAVAGERDRLLTDAGSVEVERSAAATRQQVLQGEVEQLTAALQAAEGRATGDLQRLRQLEAEVEALSGRAAAVEVLEQTVQGLHAQLADAQRAVQAAAEAEELQVARGAAEEAAAEQRARAEHAERRLQIVVTQLVEAAAEAQGDVHNHVAVPSSGGPSLSELKDAVVAHHGQLQRCCDVWAGSAAEISEDRLAEGGGLPGVCVAALSACLAAARHERDAATRQCQEFRTSIAGLAVTLTQVCNELCAANLLGEEPSRASSPARISLRKSGLRDDALGVRDLASDLSEVAAVTVQALKSCHLQLEGSADDLRHAQQQADTAEQAARAAQHASVTTDGACAEAQRRAVEAESELSRVRECAAQDWSRLREDVNKVVQEARAKEEATRSDALAAIQRAQAAEGERSAAVAALSAAQVKVTELGDRLNSLLQEKEHVAPQFAHALAENKVLREQLAECRSRIASLLPLKSAASRRDAAVRVCRGRRAAALKTAHQEKKRRTGTETQLAALRTQLAAGAKQLVASQATAGQLRGRVDELEGKLTRSEGLLTKLDVRRAELELDRRRLQERHIKLEGDYEARAMELTLRGKEIAHLTDELGIMRAKERSAATEAAKWKSKHGAACREAQTAAAAAESAAREAERDSGVKQGELLHMLEQAELVIQAAQGTSGRLLGECDAFRQREEVLAGELSTAHEQLASLMEVVARAQSDLTTRLQGALTEKETAAVQAAGVRHEFDTVARALLATQQSLTAAEESLHHERHKGALLETAIRERDVVASTVQQGLEGALMETQGHLAAAKDKLQFLDEQHAYEHHQLTGEVTQMSVHLDSIAHFMADEGQRRAAADRAEHEAHLMLARRHNAQLQAAVAELVDARQADQRDRAQLRRTVHSLRSKAAAPMTAEAVLDGAAPGSLPTPLEAWANGTERPLPAASPTFHMDAVDPEFALTTGVRPATGGSTPRLSLSGRSPGRENAPWGAPTPELVAAKNDRIAELRAALSSVSQEKQALERLVASQEAPDLKRQVQEVLQELQSVSAQLEASVASEAAAQAELQECRSVVSCLQARAAEAETALSECRHQLEVAQAQLVTARAAASAAELESQAEVGGLRQQLEAAAAAAATQSAAHQAGEEAAAARASADVARLHQLVEALRQQLEQEQGRIAELQQALACRQAEPPTEVGRPVKSGPSSVVSINTGRAAAVEPTAAPSPDRQVPNDPNHYHIYL